MSQPIMKKTLLASAIAVSIASTCTIAAPDQLPITNMKFDQFVYSAGGFLNSFGTVGPFDPATDLVNDPNPPLANGGRMHAPAFDPPTASGNIYSFDHFNGNPWEASQQTTYLTNKDSWAFVFDDSGTAPYDCNNPSGVTKSSGPCSVLGSYDYDVALADMTDEQIAVGMFFNWNGNNQIAVLDVFTCDSNDNCKGTGIPMANGPFPGSRAIFNAGLTCQNSASFTKKDTPLSIDILNDVLILEREGKPDIKKCINPVGPIPKNDPPGLSVTGVVSPTAEGGTAVLNGSVIDYTPKGGFEGPDSFIINVTDGTGDLSTIKFSVQVGGQLQNNFTMLDRAGNLFGGTNDVDIVWDETSFNSNALDANSSPTDTTFDLMTIFTPEPFFNFNWTAHHVRIFKNDTGAAITYNFDVTCESSDYDAAPVVLDCNKPLADQKALTRFMTMTLEPGEIGGHILFDWGKDDPTKVCGKANCDIDVVNKWSAGKWDKHGATGFKNVIHTGPAGVPPATVENSGEGNQANWVLVSGDVNGDGINASPMIDGAFEGSYANFNYTPDKAGTPREPYTDEISKADIGAFSFSMWSLFAGLFSVLGLRQFKSKK